MCPAALAHGEYVTIRAAGHAAEAQVERDIYSYGVVVRRCDSMVPVRQILAPYYSGLLSLPLAFVSLMLSNRRFIDGAHILV
jgi:hypothetical protein